MVRVLGLAALLLSGCDSVFRLHTVGPASDAMIDVMADAPPDMLIGCDASLLDATVGADTMLLRQGMGEPNPGNRYGAANTVNIGQMESAGTYSRVVLRFTLPEGVVAAMTADARVTASLTLTIRTSGGACGATCPNAATSFQAYALRDDWNEGEDVPYEGASWANRVGTNSTTQTPWGSPGAEGLEDRSQVAVGTAIISAQDAAAGGEISLPIELTAELGARITGNRISFLLARTSGGTLFLLSREAQPTASRLTFSICP